MRNIPKTTSSRLVAVIFFILFCVCMPIALMNLLVGLAVSDVDVLKRDAKITELRSKLETILHWDYSLPTFIAKKLDLLR